VIPNLVEAAQRLGVSVSLLPVVFAGLLTGFVLLVQAATRWFEDRKS
jgi:hypothetical protein